MIHFTLRKKLLSTINNFSSEKLSGQKLADLKLKINLKINNNEVIIIIELLSNYPINWPEITKELKAKIEKSHEFNKIDVIINSHNHSSTSQILHNNKKLILICSAKGGVGKSTIAANLAIAMQQLGRKSALVDADIHGPSAHILLDTMDKKPQIKDGLIVPIEAYNIKLNSMGMITPQDKALIWRGPMLGKALDNLLNNTDWQDSEYLFIDLPPGTGDVYLNLLKKYPAAQAVLISTPQKISLIDVARSVDLLRKLNIKILGIIENMFREEHDNSYVTNFSKQQKLNYLGKISYNYDIVHYCDISKPAILNKKISFKQEIIEIAQKILN